MEITIGYHYIRDKSMKKEVKQTIQERGRYAETPPVQGKSGRVSESRALARKLRTTGRIVSLAADVTEELDQLSALHTGVPGALEKARREFRDSALKIQRFSTVRTGMEKMEESDRDTVSELLYAAEDISRVFDKIDKTFRKTVESILDDEQRDAETGKTAAELEKSIDVVGDIAERVRRLADRADVAGLNASLEAGRAGEKGQTFSIVAASAQKSASHFMQAADEFDSLTAAVRQRAADISKKRLRSAERLRAVTVLARSITGIFDEMADHLDDLRESADALSFVVDEGNPLVESLSGAEESLSELISSTIDGTGSLADQYTTIGVVSGDLMSISRAIEMHAARIAGDNPDSSGDVCDTAERLGGLVAYRQESVSLLSESCAAITGHLDSLMKTASDSGELFVSAVKSLGEVASKASSSAALLESFRTRLADAAGVLKDMSRELSGLKREEQGFADASEVLLTTLERMSMFSFELAGLSTALDTIALNGRLELHRAKADGNGLSAYVQEFEAISSDTGGTRNDIRRYADSIRDKMHFVNKHTHEEWDVRAEVIRNLVEDSETVIDTSIRAAADAIAVIDHLSADKDKQEKDIAENASQILEMLSNGISGIREAESAIAGQRDKMTRIEETIAKIIELTESLYDDDRE